MRIVDLRMDGLDIGTAIMRTKDGKKIKRPHWKGYWQLCEVKVSSDKKVKDVPEGAPRYTGRIYNVQKETFLIAFLENGTQAPAQPYQEDLLAEDWMEVPD